MQRRMSGHLEVAGRKREWSGRLSSEARGWIGMHGDGGGFPVAIAAIVCIRRYQAARGSLESVYGRASHRVWSTKEAPKPRGIGADQMRSCDFAAGLERKQHCLGQVWRWPGFDQSQFNVLDDSAIDPDPGVLGAGNFALAIVERPQCFLEELGVKLVQIVVTPFSAVLGKSRSQATSICCQTGWGVTSAPPVSDHRGRTVPPKGANAPAGWVLVGGGRQGHRSGPIMGIQEVALKWMCAVQP